MFAECNGYSPVAQDFIWLGEYVDGTHLAEFDFITKKENSYYAIQKDKLIRFGLIGHGTKLFFEIDGIFNIAGRSIQVSYITEDKEYFLTGRMDCPANDVTTYKDAVSSGLANYSPAAVGEGGKLGNTILQYTFGFKNVIMQDGIGFHFKAHCKVPKNQPMYMSYRLVSDHKLDGKFCIRVNGILAMEMYAPLEPNVGGELNWVIQ